MDFTRKNEGVWFYFDPKNEAVGGVCVRRLSTKKAKEIEKLTVSTKLKFKRGQTQPYEIRTVNDVLEEKLVTDYVIVDWKNVSFEGQTPDCDRAGKLLMMESDEFKLFVKEALDTLEETNTILEAAVLKNGVGGSSGNSKKKTAANVKSSS